MTLYDGERAQAEYDSNWSLQAKYTLEGDSYYDPAVSMRRGGATSYYMLDALGSVRKLSDASQAATDTYSYEAFGGIVASSGSTTNPYRYVGSLGYYRDSTSGLLQREGRYYDPAVGRWFTSEYPGPAKGNEPDWAKRIRECIKSCATHPPDQFVECFVKCIGQGFNQDLCVKHGCELPKDIYECPPYGNPCDPNVKWPQPRGQCQDCCDLKHACCRILNPGLGLAGCNNAWEKCALDCDESMCTR